jgi:DNA-directed RNA polymerase subunit M/transcription elongation factor TFIIS
MVYTDTSYNDLRRGYLILIAALIEGYLIDGDINDYADMIITIELSCYNDSLNIAEQELLPNEFSNRQFEQLYRTRVMRITKNLDNTSEVGDEYLATGLLNGAIDPVRVSLLDDRDLSPSRNEHLIEQLNARLNQKANIKTSSLYKCRQCGHKESTVRSMQMRSLDEPATLIITCMFCGHKWFN